MIAAALAMALVGLALSALMSGSETGFYRATRLRLVVDALGGDRVSRWLLWLINQPALFVATILVGNNLANYLLSLGVVLAAHRLSGADSMAAELAAPILLAPVLFVYGELLPKNLFLQAPNRLLRLVAAPVLVLAAVLLPGSLLLWGLSRMLARWLGESTEAIRLRLARGELRQALEEGQEAGILQPVQQALADAVFQLGNRPVAPMAVPPERVARARADMARDEVLRLARRYRLSVIPVESADDPGRLTGYYQTIDVLLAGDDRMPDLLPLPEILADEPHLAALARLHTEQAAMARVVDRRGQIVGVVTLEQLREPLWRAGA